MTRFYSFFLCLIGAILLFSSCSSSNKEKVFEQEVAEQNKMCPMMIDAYTRVDSIRYTASDNTFQYYYTLIGDADSYEFTSRKHKELMVQFPKEIKQAPGLAIHRNHKVIMEYIYFSENNGKEWFRIHITPDMYQ